MLWQWRRCDALRLCWSGTRGPHSCCTAAAAVDMSCAAGQRPPFESQPAKRAMTDLRSWTVSCRRRPDRYTRRPNSQTTYYSENQAFCFELFIVAHLFGFLPNTWFSSLERIPPLNVVWWIFLSCYKKITVNSLWQSCGSMTFWCGSGSGSGSADPWIPCLWLMDPDPSIFIIDFQDANKKPI